MGDFSRQPSPYGVSDRGWGIGFWGNKIASIEVIRASIEIRMANASALADQPAVAASKVERTLSERVRMYDVDGDGQLGDLEKVRPMYPLDSCGRSLIAAR